MPRRISMSLTTRQFLAGEKIVTRRNGWEHLKAGNELIVVEKAMGLRKGEKHVVLGRIRVTEARRERLDAMLTDTVYGSIECSLEGFPGMAPAEFVAMFCRSHAGVKPSTVVTRILFERLSC